MKSTGAGHDILSIFYWSTTGIEWAVKGIDASQKAISGDSNHLSYFDANKATTGLCKTLWKKKKD